MLSQTIQVLMVRLKLSTDPDRWKDAHFALCKSCLCKSPGLLQHVH